MHIIWALQGDTEEIRRENVDVSIKFGGFVEFEVAKIENDNAKNTKDTVEAHQEKGGPHIIAHGSEKKTGQLGPRSRSQKNK